ncbi:MAG: metal-dependent transcriptional regulator [Bacteroidetes bacterium]|jgi:DtxR family Mn-dependent transcriptional regulator|nr:MAG: metal-dependent transcriptional regulator [Bacteroidota bacterium]REK36121.1 MAG: metal-dependent transcriptional regulator [Bacteroidota bacterium]REK51508.1 MAG: metal-dependent transcriptional regulator [Bacteroidota bacterium]
MHSLTEENYLKAIYRLSQKGLDKITPTALAEEMSINAASVVDMIRKLSDKKLINYDKQKGAKLTAQGNKIALDIVRKHRLWEVFLLEKLGYSWDVVHEIAEQLEHIKHEELADRLDKFLGYPEYDPHGDPIPNAKGEIPSIANTLLSEIEVGKTCQVTAVKDTSAVFLQYLEQLSIKIGTKIKVLEKIPFDASMAVQIEKDVKTTVSKKFAESLFVS